MEDGGKPQSWLEFAFSLQRTKYPAKEGKVLNLLKLRKSIPPVPVVAGKHIKIVYVGRHRKGDN